MSLLLNVPHTYRKDGVYYLQRYVPEDVRKHYKTNRISFLLRTKSAREACVLSRSASAKLEAYWHSLRLAYGEAPAQHLVSLRSQDHGDGTDREQPVDLSLTEAGEVYLRLKGSNKPKTFHSAVERALSYVVKVIGNKPLQAISRKDAAAVRDDLVAKASSKGTAYFLVHSVDVACFTVACWKSAKGQSHDPCSPQEGCARSTPKLSLDADATFSILVRGTRVGVGFVHGCLPYGHDRLFCNS
ncbi:DUF6538 domain-containing protein [Rhodobacteraceae bacterium nBUS_22]